MLFQPLIRKILSVPVQRRFALFSLSSTEALFAESLIRPLSLADFCSVFRRPLPLELFDSARLFFHRLSLSATATFYQFL